MIVYLNISLVDNVLLPTSVPKARETEIAVYTAYNHGHLPTMSNE